MLTSKFDLYKIEWIDVVFENRNKTYGAYYLRQHYAGNMVKAMGITFTVLSVLCASTIFFKSHPALVVVPSVHIVPVKLSEIHIAQLPKAAEAPKAHAPVKTTAFVPFEVQPDNLVHNPPPITIEIKGEVGQTTNTKGSTVNPGPIDTKPEGTGNQPAPDVSIHTINGVDVMPEPVGGENAWTKFLNRNLKFPPGAQDVGVSGKVILNFIIEKDGNLSNIVIERGAGYGFDEEALRVLKLAKAWKPGMQNGQPVRVRYAIPINFQLSSE